MKIHPVRAYSSLPTPHQLEQAQTTANLETRTYRQKQAMQMSQHTTFDLGFIKKVAVAIAEISVEHFLMPKRPVEENNQTAQDKTPEHPTHAEPTKTTKSRRRKNSQLPKDARDATVQEWMEKWWSSEQVPFKISQAVEGTGLSITQVRASLKALKVPSIGERGQTRYLRPTSIEDEDEDEDEDEEEILT